MSILTYQLMVATFRMVQRWWMAYVYAFLFMLHAAGTAFVAAFTGANWALLSGTQRAVIIAAIIVNVSGALMSFLSQTVSRIKSGQNVIPTGDTTQQQPPPAKS